MVLDGLFCNLSDLRVWSKLGVWMNSSFGYDTSSACTTPDSLPEYGLIYGLHDPPASLFAESVQMLTAQLTPQCPFELFELEQQRSLHAEQLALPPYSNQVTVLTAFEKGLAAFLAGRHTEAQSRFQLAASEFHNQGDVRGEADSLLHLGMSFRYSRDFVTARSSLLAAQSMYTSLGSDHRAEQLQCARHLARAEEDRGNRHQALVAYQELLSTTEREGFITQHYWCLYYLGHLYNRMKIYEEAAAALKDVVNKSREICDGEMEGFATEELGYTAESQKHPRLAMSCYEKALQIFKMNGEGRWLESEGRVKKRMNQLRHGYPELLRVEDTWGWSIGAKI
ncbi:hypothetical protein RhiLY_11275 [Ceratobasidium sp. AG-Ba]|nr:hypothetical protein RhiLY_11275 [Ceratobasidium sp. AG-Ba]